MENINKERFLKGFDKLINIDSATGFNSFIEKEIIDELKEFKVKGEKTHKGGVIACLGGECNPLVITAHLDTLGLMVRSINSNGTLRVTNVGGLHAFYSVLENVRVYTRGGKVYTGTIVREPNSVHVTENEISGTLPDYTKNVCVVLDCDVKTKEDVLKLGIESGDYIHLDPRCKFENGYLKSRFIDDKASAVIMMEALRYIKENNIKLKRKIYYYFACYEEVGHGTTYLPDGIKDILAVDIAPIGEYQTSDEKKVSIFAKDSRFPYNYEFTNELRSVAIENKIDYCLDVFTPHYGSDGDGSVMAGYDVRHGCIGFGTRNSHGYERTHIDGINETYKLLLAYILK